MIYGYAILKSETETYGLPIYRSEDFGVCYSISKVRLFSSKKERDNGIELEIKNKKVERDSILPFVTKGKQGKLNFGSTTKKKRNCPI